MRVMNMVSTIVGLTVIPSERSVTDTMNRFEVAVRERAMLVFARIDHAAGARDAGLELWPIEVLLFGSPLVGTRLMQQSPTIGLDLPLRVLVWEDATGAVWLAYHEPSWLAASHRIGAETAAVTHGMSVSLQDLARLATSGV